ncbi:hypothetical protein GF373_04115 [bacterium]|nr:hypothetical protein [bacterium]
MKKLLALLVCLACVAGCSSMQTGGMLQTDYHYISSSMSSGSRSFHTQRGRFSFETGADQVEMRASGVARQRSSVSY